MSKKEIIKNVLFFLVIALVFVFIIITVIDLGTKNFDKIQHKSANLKD